ncbi:MAG: sugar ABC transporter permease [Epulopiscium sp. Nele67-Bin002]|nr:MAG: sugar ABC transporter permease [Epulopiscium sp. Nele67-Bin002]OON91889.1 MAG: sugar ABC transporter permease [Epulopiscium sp. Nele67-Bin001]
MKKAPQSLLLSIFVWGSGQFFIGKQRIKGLLFFLMQAIVVGVELNTGYWVELISAQQLSEFQMRLHGGFFTKGIWGLITLGEVPGAKGGDHSMMLMITGIIAAMLLIIIGLIYVWNLKDAYATGKLIDEKQTYISSKDYFKSLYETKFEYIVLSPIVLAVLFISIMPILFSILTAFTSYSAGNLPPAKLVDWVGFENFFKLFTVPIWSSTFFGVLQWTLIWTVAATLSTYFLGMVQALILNNQYVKCKSMFRTILILPWVVPSLISLLVFRNVFNGQFGPLNQFLLESGLIASRIPFLTDPMMAKITILLVNLWLGFPSAMLMISGVLSNMDPSMYEAAQLDGATSAQEFRYITLPLLLKVTMPLLVMSFAFNFNNFGAVFFLTEGGPANPNYQFAGHTDILISWIYKLTMDNQMYNMASVMSILIFIVIGSVSYWNFKNTTSFKEV